MMHGSQDKRLACPACGAALETGTAQCDRCGRMIYRTAESGTPATTRNVDERRMIDRPWFVLLLLFGVTAALGLPILWYSRGFSAAAKVLVSLLVTVYTVALLGAFALLMQWCVARIMNAIG